MRILLGAVASLFLLAGPAMADDMMANFYGNTVQVSNPEAGDRTVLINEDGTYQQIAADGTTVDGTWSMEGDEACFESAATAETGPYCVDATQSRDVGETWEITTPDGVTETATLVEGR